MTLSTPSTAGRPQMLPSGSRLDTALLFLRAGLDALFKAPEGQDNAFEGTGTPDITEADALFATAMAP